MLNSLETTKVSDTELTYKVNRTTTVGDGSVFVAKSISNGTIAFINMVTRETFEVKVENLKVNGVTLATADEARPDGEAFNKTGGSVKAYDDNET